MFDLRVLRKSSSLAGKSSSAHEQEADDAAARATRAPAPRAGLGAAEGALDNGSKAYFGSLLGFDFGHVRIHADSEAAEAARGLHAQAFTVGHDVAFAAGRFNPRSPEGRGLLAHELTHVAQQAAGPATLQRKPDVGPASKPASAPAASEPRAPERPPPDETTEARLQRQARSLVRTFSELVVSADREGFAAMTIYIEHNGRELVPGFEKRGPGASRPRASLSAAQVASAHLEPELQMILMSGEGKYQIDWIRMPDGRFEMQIFQRVPPAPPPSGSGGDDLDLPDRKKIYAEIFRKTEAELKDAGVMVASFGLEQIVLWIAGGILFRALGFAGEAAFPVLRRALSLGRKTNIARALGTLAESEAAVFTRLMKGAETNALSAAEKTQLNALMGKVEAALAADVPTLRLVGRIKEFPSLVKEAESLGEVPQREVDDLIARYLGGNTNPGLGTKVLDGDIKYLRGRNGGRVFYRENAQGYMEILGKADKGNEDRVINLVLSNFR